MKSLTGRIAPQQTHLYAHPQQVQAHFDPQGLLWQISLPGARAAAALRGLLQQASRKFGEGDFSYQRVSDVLLDQQRVIFGGGQDLDLGNRPSARRWGQSVWLDLQIRTRLPLGENVPFPSSEALYQEYLQFADLLGLNSARLPVTFAAFRGWADASFTGWEAENYRQLALRCIVEVLPLCWPVNIAVILYLLPGEFWGVYGRSLGKDSARLAALSLGRSFNV